MKIKGKKKTSDCLGSVQLGSVANERVTPLGLTVSNQSDHSHRWTLRHFLHNVPMLRTYGTTL